MTFYSFCFHLDPLTLILKLKPDRVEMYLHTENEISRYDGSKVIDQTHTDNPTEMITYPHTQLVTMVIVSILNKSSNSPPSLLKFPITTEETPYSKAGWSNYKINQITGVVMYVLFRCN